MTPVINALRHRQIKNALAMLMVSQGVPMILMGDEMGRTQGGNNNTYCLDNELNWLDWRLLETNHGLFRFFKNMIAFRRAHPVLRSKSHFRNQDYVGSGYADITWHGTGPGRPIGRALAACWLSCWMANTPRAAPSKITQSTWLSTCIGTGCRLSCRGCRRVDVGT